MEVLKVQLGFACFLAVGSTGRSGGVCLFWRREVSLVLRTYSQFHFDVFVSDTNSGVSWCLTAIYGHPETTLRRHTWDLLRLLKDQISGPWLCCGDVNEILDISKKLGGRERPASQMRGFLDALDYCQLRSIPVVGPLYTWSHFREGFALVHEQSNRFLSNVYWLDLFPNCRVSNLITPVSNHICLVLNTEGSVQAAPWKSRLFKFESMWVGERGCEESIARAWSLNSNTSLADKIKQCSSHLSDWSKVCFGNVRPELAQKRWELEQLQNISCPSYPLQDIRREELMWQQRSCVQWLQNDEGIMHEGTEMLLLIHEYFSTLFSLHPVQSCISETMNSELTRMFIDAKIKAALFQVQPLKASGPDSMPPLFFQKYWHLVGRVMPPDLNLTHIVLILKNKNPEYLKDYQPISLCNVVYKVIAKVLANRLKLVLPGVISENQSAFTMDAIRRRKHGNKGWMSIKLDMSKAYDRVEWIFLERLMQRMGFHSNFIRLIMIGFTTQPITPSRGLRQGCPLSPYLFVLCAEALSLLLKQADAQHHLRGVSVCHNAPRVSHLFFAGDSIMFCRASVSENEYIKNLQLNMGKTELLFSHNTEPTIQSAIKGVWGVQDVQHHTKYLGLPSFVGKSRFQIFKAIKDRLLSQAGCEVLIKAVVQAIPTYTISCFKLLKVFCKEIEGLGFRDLETFNLALLAKQGWRLLHSQGSLFASIFKANIYEAKAVIKTGSLWHIGWVDKIKIWTDHWLAESSPRKVISCCNTLAEDACVADLLDSSSPNGWNTGLVQQIFLPFEVHSILKTPLFLHWGDDKLVWSGTKNGVFTVKLAYYIAINLKTGVECGSSSPVLAFSSFWSVLWNLQLPPKIKNFIRRACKDSLSTKRLLFKRHVLASSTCDFCHDALWEMYFGRDLRLLHRYYGFDNVVKAMIGFNDPILLTRFVLTAWGVWKFRNLKLFQQTNSDACILIRQHVKIHPNISSLHWSPPPCGAFKLNVDGAIFDSLNISGVGAILQDDMGSLVMALSRKELSIHVVEDIEALAALRGLQLISHMGISHLILEEDSLAMVEAFALWGLQLISHMGISHLILEGDSLAMVEALRSTRGGEGRCISAVF
ncbi:hypothetical protein I3843_10G116000 [Carya illinoinensis]|nr:hypothetical protein I3843_10G116000 [Carya illinoinensis]